MSALGNGSLSGFDFKVGNVLADKPVTSTQPVPFLYNSKSVGGKKRKTKLSSLRSVKSNRNIEFSSRLFGGSRKTRKSRRKSKKRC